LIVIRKLGHFAAKESFPLLPLPDPTCTAVDFF
jgi:hypothetical protein